MHTFNKNKALKKINNKNNKKVKIFSVVVAIVILIGAIIYFSFAKFEFTQYYSLINGNVAEPPRGIAKQLIELKKSGTTDLGYDGVASLGEYGTSDNNLRYVGGNPNNYVYFNCSTTNIDEMNDATCEKWKIVGVYNNIEDENGKKAPRVKIIRSESLGMYSWDTKPSNIFDGFGVNIWGESEYQNGDVYEGSKLMQELNNDYLGNITVGTDGKWYNGQNDSKTANMPISTLSTSAQSMIETVKWNTGANVKISGNIKTLYESEKNTKELGYNSLNIKINAIWTGKVGLMNASDYNYVQSYSNGTINSECLAYGIDGWDEKTICTDNNWIYQAHLREWFINAIYYQEDENEVFATDSDMDIYPAEDRYNVRPAIYLKSNVVYNGGNGTSSNPYKLVIE